MKLNITKEMLETECSNLLTISEIAAKYNVNYTTIRSKLKKYNIKSISILDKIKKELLYNKYNMLQVIEYIGIDNTYNKEHLWLCLCSCGNTTSISTRDLKNNRVISCGCIKKGKNSCLYRGYEDISSTYFTTIKRQCNRKSKKIEFNITIEYIWNLFLKQHRKCALSGVEIRFNALSGKNSGKQTASLDRIDSSKGYIEGNVQWVHKKVNLMKMSLDDNEFISWCHKISDYRKMV